LFAIRNWEHQSNQQLLGQAFEFIAKKEMAYQTQKQFIGALTLFYKEVYGRVIHLDTLRPTRKPSKIPVVLANKR